MGSVFMVSSMGSRLSSQEKSVVCSSLLLESSRFVYSLLKMVSSRLDFAGDRTSSAIDSSGGLLSAMGSSGGLLSAMGSSGGLPLAMGSSGGLPSAMGSSGGLLSAMGSPGGLLSAIDSSCGLPSAMGLPGGLLSAIDSSRGFSSTTIPSSLGFASIAVTSFPLPSPTSLSSGERSTIVSSNSCSSILLFSATFSLVVGCLSSSSGGGGGGRLNTRAAGWVGLRSAWGDGLTVSTFLPSSFSSTIATALDLRILLGEGPGEGVGGGVEEVEETEDAAGSVIS